MARTSVPDTTAGDAQRSAPSVLLNGLRVLESFTNSEPVLGVTEIARRVGLHKSTVSRILATLEQAGYVERGPAGGRFRLGLGLIALAGPLLADLDVRRLARPTLERLVAATGETTALMLWDGVGAVVAEQVPSPHEVKHTAPIGKRWVTYNSSSVQAFVSTMPEPEIERLLEGGVLVGNRSATALREYRTRLADARRIGYAVNDGLTSEEEVGIAAVARDHRDDVVAAVLLSAPRFRVSRERIEEIGPQVAAAAQEISAHLGMTATRAGREPWRDAWERPGATAAR